MSVAQAEKRLTTDHFAAFLGVIPVEIAPERAVLRMPFRDEHANAAGPLNGGASASLLLMAGTVAAWTGIDLDVPLSLDCVEMTIQYLAAVMHDDVIATGRVLRRGKDLFFLEVALQTPDQKPVCQGLMTYRSPDYRAHPPRLRAQPLLRPAPQLLTPPDATWILQGYVEKLQVRATHASAGRISMMAPCPQAHTDATGHLHPGVLASLIDVTGTAAAWSLVPNRQGARGSTIGMHVSYTAPTTETVLADAHVQQRSEEIFFSSVQVTGATSGQLVALGEVTYRLLEAR